jgi:hypothetical protein
LSSPRRSDIPDEVVARRLDDLAQIDRLMRALREVRFVEDASHVRERPPPPWHSPPIPPRPDERRDE